MQSENILLVDKYKIEKEQNAQLRNQVAQLLQLEQEQNMQIQQQELTIQTLQVGPIAFSLSAFYFFTVSTQLMHLHWSELATSPLDS